MRFEKDIPLTAYEVEYIDQRQPKPRTVHKEIVVPTGMIYHQAALEASASMEKGLFLSLGDTIKKRANME